MVSAMQALTLPGSNVTYTYVDSRAPPGAGAYDTFVVVHGLGFNASEYALPRAAGLSCGRPPIDADQLSADVFERIMAIAPTRGIRIVAVNRRNYAGSTPYTAEEASVFARGSSTQRRDLMLDEGARLAGFIAALARRLAPQREGRLHVVAWSLGNAYLLAMLASVGLLDPDDRQTLRRHLGSAIFFGRRMPYVEANIADTNFRCACRCAWLREVCRRDAHIGRRAAGATRCTLHALGDELLHARPALTCSPYEPATEAAGGG